MAENANDDNTTAKQTYTFFRLANGTFGCDRNLKSWGEKGLKANMILAAFVAEEAVRRHQR